MVAESHLATLHSLPAANEVKCFKRATQEDKAALALPSFDALEDRLQEEVSDELTHTHTYTNVQSIS